DAVPSRLVHRRHDSDVRADGADERVKLSPLQRGGKIAREAVAPAELFVEGWCDPRMQVRADRGPARLHHVANWREAFRLRRHRVADHVGRADPVAIENRLDAAQML